MFLVGENGQLYIRTGPYLEGDGKFKFGPGVVHTGVVPRERGGPITADHYYLATVAKKAASTFRITASEVWVPPLRAGQTI